MLLDALSDFVADELSEVLLDALSDFVADELDDFEDRLSVL